MANIDYKQEILRLKQEKNAVILAHYYQENDVQDVADFLGDSLNLSQTAVNTQADIIVFCGVHFMAETAKILSPDKKVLLPVMNAGCQMADMVSAEQLREYRSLNPDVKIISYVNTSAAVKAESDCICTSTNGLKIINHYINAGEKILYAPDQNLGKYAMQLMNKQFDVWNGNCPIHHFLNVNKVLELKNAHPESLIITHPECQLDVLAVSDYVGSTAQLISYVNSSPAKTFIVCTEKGVLHPMRKQNPDKEFILGSHSLNCFNMKKTSLADVYNCLATESNEIFVDETIRTKAIKSLNKMLELSK